MKALVGAFNQEKALVGAFSVIVKTDCETDEAIHSTGPALCGQLCGRQLPAIVPTQRADNYTLVTT